MSRSSMNVATQTASRVHHFCSMAEESTGGRGYPEPHGCDRRGGEGARAAAGLVGPAAGGSGAGAGAERGGRRTGVRGAGRGLGGREAIARRGRGGGGG